MADQGGEVGEHRGSMDPAAGTAEVRAHMQRILASPQFVNARQLQLFLDHLVNTVLDGHGDELKEYSLGRDVFRRGESYDPRTDAIVRVQASILRKRLATYYAEGGREEPFRIDLPKGSYVPQFVPASGGAPGAPVAEAVPEQPANAITRRGWLRLSAAFAAGAGAVGGAWLLSHIFPSRTADPGGEDFSFAASEASPRIWGHLLNGEQPIQLAFGCPQFFRGGGLYLRDVEVNDTQENGDSSRIQDLTRQLGKYLAPAPNTYTGVGEILGIYRMTRFVTHQGVGTELDNIQLLSPESIRNKNLILVSSYRFRTLLDIMSLPKAFESRTLGGGGFRPLNRHEDDPEFYGPVNSGGVSRSYGLVSYWTKPETGGRVLLMSGIESWATLGAVIYITSEEHLRDLERRLAGTFTGDSKGIQILVEIEGHEERPVHVRYVTHRVL